MSSNRIDTVRIFPRRLTLDAVMPGTEFEEVVFGPLTREDFVRYAQASGDDNPIHQDEEYARRQGAPTVFAMGMLNAGFLATALSHWIGGPHNIRRYKTRFTNRVWAGDDLVCSGRVDSIDDGLIGIALQARRRGGGPPGMDVENEQSAIVGEAEVELFES